MAATKYKIFYYQGRQGRTAEPGESTQHLQRAGLAGDANVAEVSLEDVKTAPVLPGDESADEAYESEFNDDYWRRFLEEFEKVKEDTED